MKFIKDGEIYKVMWISGPRHNLLGLVFSHQTTEGENIELIALNSKAQEASNIDPHEVKEQVIAGINEINNQLKLNYKLKQIHYVPSDTPSNDIYKELSKEIIRKLNTSDKFE